MSAKQACVLEYEEKCWFDEISIKQKGVWGAIFVLVFFFNKRDILKGQNLMWNMTQEEYLLDETKKT